MFNIFKKKEDKSYELLEQVKELELKIKCLRNDAQTARDELSTVRHQKKLEEEDIKHMVKMKEEKMELDFDKRVVKIEREQADAIATVKDKYQDKQTEYLNKQIEQGAEDRKEILERLPKINVKLNGDI